jgi:hypothetical protein
MFGAFVSRIKRKSLIIFLSLTRYCFCIHFYVTICMKLDPGMHIGLHLVSFGKSGVTHRVVAAAPAPAPTTPRTPSPLSCVTRRVSTLGESWDYRVEPRRQTLGNLAAGRPYPASTTVGTFRRTLELPRKTVGGDKAHRGLHAGVAATDPLGSGAARHLFFQPHNGPQGSQPHRQPGIQSGWPVTGRPPRGPQGSRTHPRSGDPVRPAQLRGGVFGLFKFQKIVFPFEKS